MRVLLPLLMRSPCLREGAPYAAVGALVDGDARNWLGRERDLRGKNRGCGNLEELMKERKGKERKGREDVKCYWI